MFKSSGRRLSQLPSCISHCYCCYCYYYDNRDGVSRGEKLLAFPWSSLAIYFVSLTSRATVRSFPVRSFDDNGNESKSTMTMINLMYQRVTKIGIGIGIKENERNATMMLLLLLLTRAQAGREV